MKILHCELVTLQIFRGPVGQCFSMFHKILGPQDIYGCLCGLYGKWIDSVVKCSRSAVLNKVKEGCFLQDFLEPQKLIYIMNLLGLDCRVSEVYLTS